MNVHHTRWLRHSSRNSAEGEHLRDFSDRAGLKQLVREPTRGDYLLDLAFTDVDDVRCAVVNKIADHKGLMITLPLAVPRVATQSRLVWQFIDADWDGLRWALASHDWSWISSVDPNVGAEQLTSRILCIAEQFIPRRLMLERKSTHPWINENVLRSVREKMAGEGTDREDALRIRCSSVIMEEYGKYIARERVKLQSLPKGAKAWWSKSRRLMQRKGIVSSVPALKDPHDQWVLAAQNKADLFADSFSMKFVLSAAVVNEYSQIPPGPSRPQAKLKNLNEKDAKNVMEKLRVDSGTGPDLLPARILRYCAEVLAKPVLLLALSILSTGIWPQLWRQHWITPLFKKKSIYNPGNYRGIHLTPQLSKVRERLLKLLYDPYLSATCAFGQNQFAYSVGRGARDALALLLLTWIKALCTGRKVGVYCSDVSGAFDRVCMARLVAKLKKKGLHPQIVAVLSSWLEDRLAQVVVNGTASSDMTLRNMVFQGTVTGPILWNLFFEDARLAINGNRLC